MPPSFSKDFELTLVPSRPALPITGVLVDEQTVVAIVIEEQKMVEFGKAAGDMAGRVQSETIRWRILCRTVWWQITRSRKHYCTTCSNMSAGR